LLVFLPSSSPWSWYALPSTFESKDLKEFKQKTLKQRQQNTILFSLNSYISTISYEYANRNNVTDSAATSKLQTIRLLSNALRQKDLKTAIKILEPLYSTHHVNPKYQTERVKKAIKKQLDLGGLEGSVIKEVV